MLSIGKLVAGQEAYYDQQVAHGGDDYYEGKGEAKGEWSGSASADLDLKGEVDSEAFAQLIAGADPGSGHPLRDTIGTSKVAAFDLTFSAPKSVSVLYALADPSTAKAMLASHRAAVKEAMAYLEDEACKVRRGKGGAQTLEASGFISASYRHRMSREQDPQLHTHVVTANLTKGSDGRFSALDSTRLYRHAKAAGTLYQAHLRYEVRRRAPQLTWGPVSKGMAELEQVPEAVLRQFSKRRRQIEEAVAEFGREGKGTSERAALGTRTGKEAIDDRHWKEDLYPQAAEYGLGREQLDALAIAQPIDVAADATSTDQHLSPRLFGPEGMTEMHNTFAPRHLQIEVASAYRQGAPAGSVRKQTRDLLEAGPVQRVATVEERYTTDDLLAHERAIVSGAVRRAGEGAMVLDPNLIEGTLRDRALPLNEEQSTAIRAITRSGRGVDPLEALAGTGKTTIAGVLREAYEAGGEQVVGAAQTARAVRELSERAGVTRSGTIARLRIELERAGGFNFPDGAVLILDEVSMANTREISSIMAAAERCRVKVVAIGDSGQLPSVEAGGWFGSLSQRLPSPKLTEVMRQRDVVERRLLAHVHDGSPLAYVRHKQEVGELHIHESPEAGEGVLVTQWAVQEARLGKGRAVMITRDNSTRQRLNDRARDHLRSRREIGPDVEFGERSFAVGDRVIARRNDRLLDVDNGMRGTVRAIDEAKGELILETDSSGIRTFGHAYAANQLEHAYALTGHGLQGATVEWAGVIGEPSDFTRNWSYTALSRAREPTQVHVVDSELEDTERESVAPGASPELRDDVISRLTRRMQIRDDEDLAIDQLPDGPKPIEPAEIHPQEAGARALDPAVPQVPAVREQEAERLTARQAEPDREVAVARERHIEASVAAPPAHLTAALGAPPRSRFQRKGWERAARAIERYRFDNQITSLELLGARPAGGPELVRYKIVENELVRGQRLLGRENGLTLERGL